MVLFSEPPKSSVVALRLLKHLLDEKRISREFRNEKTRFGIRFRKFVFLELAFRSDSDSKFSLSERYLTRLKIESNLFLIFYKKTPSMRVFV